MYKLKLLIVDDDPDILELLESTLESEFELIKASTGKEALEKLKGQLPDLLVLDYMLPDLEGPQICKIIRKDPLLSNLPVLMLTGKGELEHKVEGLESGADDYMTKPVNLMELLARISALVRRSQVNIKNREVIKIDPFILSRVFFRVG